MVYPLGSEFLLHRVLAQTLIERRPIDVVQRLVLVEAREHIGRFARLRVDVRLQALWTARLGSDLRKSLIRIYSIL